MASNIVNNVAFLRVQRDFPEEIVELTKEIDKAYVDTSNAVNARTIGLFPVNRPAINGESWFFNGKIRQQAFRQVYTFTGAGSIPHNIPHLIPGGSSRSFGSYTDGTGTYGVIFASSVGIAGQVTFSLTATDIVIVVDAGAPPVTTGFVVIEWLSNP